MHLGFGVNLADKKAAERNILAVNFAQKLADKLDAKKIILHPGNISDDSCSILNSKEFIFGLDDRFILENCSYKNPVGGIPFDLKKLSDETGKGICFDFNHALLISNKFGKNSDGMIKEFIGLSPKHFHLCGYKVGSNKDEHLSFEDANYDYSEYFKLLPEDSEITLETSTDIGKVGRDLEYVRRVIKSIA